MLAHDEIPEYLRRFSVEELSRRAVPVWGDIRDSEAAEYLRRKLPRDRRVHVVHFAATLLLLEALSGLDHKFVFVGTAFACVAVQGTIPNEVENSRIKPAIRRRA